MMPQINRNLMLNLLNNRKLPMIPLLDNRLLPKFLKVPVKLQDIKSVQGSNQCPKEDLDRLVCPTTLFKTVTT